MTQRLKKLIVRIIIAIIAFAAAIFFRKNVSISLPLFVFSYLVVCYDVILKSIANIKNGEIFDENFLMLIATFGAFAIKDYPEAVAVMLFFQIGEAFQSYAVDHSRKSISELMDIRPDYANILVDGVLKKVDPEEIKVGDIIIVKPGEKIPLDGVVNDGFSTIDTAALTGESMPRDITIGDEVMSGCINISGLISIKVNKEFAESTVSKILDLVENASNKKASVENFITKFARYYTPIVVVSAVLLTFIPPLIMPSQQLNTWLYRGIVFLVISCPCALVISIPLSFFAGLGVASKCGILIKGSNYLEALAKTKYIVFDKTGTITKGKFNVVAIKSYLENDDELLKYAAYCESQSNHPIAISIREKYGKEIDLNKIKETKELHGLGIKTNFNGKIIYAGNKNLMDSISIDVDDVNELGTIIYVAVDGKYAGHLVIADEIKEDSRRAIELFNALGISNTTMLTGDKKEIAEHIAKQVCINKVCSELLPANKVEKVEEILKNKKPTEQLIFVGDGINDAPVLARADIGVAMGAIGSDAAIEASDIVIMGDELSKIATAITISKGTISVARQNIVFALTVKFFVLIFGAFGYTSIWLAIFADVGVSVIAILNAVRILYCYRCERLN